MDKYQSALDYIYSLVNYETSHLPRSPLNYDLRRMDELLARLDNPHLAAKTVHIAGTKGKGSTAAMVASVLTESGYRTGLYTSPHLIDTSERLRVNNRPVSRVKLVALVDRIRPEVEAVNAAALYGRLTTFEVLTALAFMFFADSRADLQVVEVGLGGRLDATNIVKPEVCAITTLGFDHTDVLGDTLAQIAAEKAGIIKPGVPVVSAKQESEAAEVIAEFCRLLRSPLTRVGQDITYSGTGVKRGFQSIEIKGRLGSYPVELPLLGQFQQMNAAVAAGILEVLAEKGYKVSRKSMVAGLRKVRWPGRFQVIRTSPRIVIDGAHNPQSAQELSAALRDYLMDGRWGRKVMVIGMSSDKDIEKFAAELSPVFDEVIATRSRHPRALGAEALARHFSGQERMTQAVTPVADAMNLAVKTAQENGFVCATGSLFVVGEALEWAGLPGF